MNDLRELRELLRRGYLWYRHRGMSSTLGRAASLLGDRRAPSGRSYTRWLADLEAAPPTARGGPLLLSLLVPVHDPPPAMLAALYESVRTQDHGAWELVLADDRSRDPAVQGLLAELARRDSRVHHVRPTESARGISAATNAAAAVARGEVLLLADHDDLLGRGVFAAVAAAFGQDPALDFAYTDEDQLTPWGQRVQPVFKPGQSPMRLLGHNYVTHLLAVRREFFLRLGGLRGEFDGSQDHDLALRAFERARRVAHLPVIGYHWRRVRGSVSDSSTAKPWAYAAGRRAVEDACRRRELPIASVEHGALPGVYLLRPRPLREPLRCHVVLRGPERGCAAWTARLPVFATLLTPLTVSRNQWPAADASAEPKARQPVEQPAAGDGEAWLVIDATLDPDANDLAELLPWLALPGVGAVAAATCHRRRRLDLGWSVTQRGTAQPILPGLPVQAAGPGFMASSVREVGAALGGLLCVTAVQRRLRATLAGRPTSAADELCLSLSPAVEGRSTLFVPGCQPQQLRAGATLAAAAPAAVDLAGCAAWPALVAVLPPDFWCAGADRYCPRHKLLTDLGLPAPVETEPVERSLAEAAPSGMTRAGSPTDPSHPAVPPPGSGTPQGSSTAV